MSEDTFSHLWAKDCSRHAWHDAAGQFAELQAVVPMLTMRAATQWGQRKKGVARRLNSDIIW